MLLLGGLGLGFLAQGESRRAQGLTSAREARASLDRARMAARIQARADVFQDMPPPGSPVPMPTAQERERIAREGAPLCAGAGTDEVPGDGGVDGGL
ncbi:hypothetical protein [Myxococcus sp. AM009]|uniref:hypothetical protein n=1 Tax=Myxococcus sp. AM009 TaxID=2745137 RepID=UPI0020CD8419|nr:hypothetical protein [Myxococcus sp. AM009]